MARKDLTRKQRKIQANIKRYEMEEQILNMLTEEIDKARGTSVKLGSILDAVDKRIYAIAEQTPQEKHLWRSCGLAVARKLEAQITSRIPSVLSVGPLSVVGKIQENPNGDALKSTE